MHARTPEQPSTRATGEQHMHHWMIEEANGPQSPAVCKTCGEYRLFKNSLADGDFLTNEERRLLPPRHLAHHRPRPDRPSHAGRQTRPAG